METALLGLVLAYVFRNESMITSDRENYFPYNKHQCVLHQRASSSGLLKDIYRVLIVILLQTMQHANTIFSNLPVFSFSNPPISKFSNFAIVSFPNSAISKFSNFLTSQFFSFSNSPISKYSNFLTC